MRIAIVGSGVSGLVAAHLLHPRHEIVLFEADERIGGHVHTHVVETPRGHVAVDTGFIVHNDRTYPNFLRLLQALGVASIPTSMGFSVRCERSGLEWSGESPNALFAQRRNLVSPAFWRMLRDLVRFQRAGRAFLSSRDVTSSLDDFLHAGGFGAELRRFYLEPMVASVWSADPERVGAFPAHALLRFFENHGLLGFTDRPQWRVVEGGSARYVDALVRPFADRIRTKSPVRRIARRLDGVRVSTDASPGERFDHVVIATHSDQALALLADPTPSEREVLGAIRYQENEAILHTDASLLPRARRAWASWNYHLPAKQHGRATVTYWMNRLQRLDAGVELCVTLNRSDAIDPARILRRITYHHPIYDGASVAAQARWREISFGDGTGPAGRTHYCGAYWANGFHEDGVRSALAACAPLGGRLP